MEGFLEKQEKWKNFHFIGRLGHIWVFTVLQRDINVSQLSVFWPLENKIKFIVSTHNLLCMQ